MYERYLVRGRDRILPACRWLHEPQLISNQPEWGWGFHTVRRGIDPWTTVFFPGLWELQMYGKSYDPGLGLYPPQVALASRTRANQQSANRVRVSITCGAVSTRGTTVFVPDVLELQTHGRIFYLGMRPSTPGTPGSPNRSQSAISLWDWGLNKVRGGIDSGTTRFRPHRVVDLWNDC